MIAAGASPVIEPQLAPPETNVLSVTVRAAVSAESLTLIVSKLGGFWMVSAPRMPCDAAAVADVDRVAPAAGAQVGRHAGGQDVDVSSPEPVVTFTLAGVGVLVVDRPRTPGR